MRRRRQAVVALALGAGTSVVGLALSATTTTTTPERRRFVIVGDCHRQYSDDDNAALAAMGADLALFVGDFGNEDAETVATVARCATEKCSIFGNHDFWHTSQPWRGHHPTTWYRSRGAARLAGLDERPTFRSPTLEALHETLDDCDVGFRRRAALCDGLFDVVGARPFSRGGDGIYKSKFYKHHYQKVRSVDDAADRIVHHCDSATLPYVLLAHNGPAGLGSRPTDICGKDWGVPPLGGDWGDRDLSQALRRVSKPPLFLAFGHMHSPLRDGRPRTMLSFFPTGRDNGDRIMCVNAAVFPRWRNDTGTGDVARHFTVVDVARNSFDGGDWGVVAVSCEWRLPSGECLERTVDYEAPPPAPR